jgi:nucleoside phosphorylase
MGAMPIAVNVQGDYGYKIVTIEPEETVESLIKTAIKAVEGILVPEFKKGTEFTAKIHGMDSFLDQSKSIKDANLIEMEAVDIAVKS